MKYLLKYLEVYCFVFISDNVFIHFLSVLHTKNEVQVQILFIWQWKFENILDCEGIYTYFDFFKNNLTVLSGECENIYILVEKKILPR